MSTKLFVGSLAWATTDDSLQQFFAQAGTVVSASVIRDKMSGRSKGFAFVEYATEEEAKNALDTLNGQELDGRAIVVSEARPREERPQGSFGNRGGGGGYNDRRGGGGGYNDRRGGGGGSRGGYNDRRGGGGGSRGGYNDRNSGSSYSSNQSSGGDYAAPAADTSTSDAPAADADFGSTSEEA